MDHLSPALIASIVLSAPTPRHIRRHINNRQPSFLRELFQKPLLMLIPEPPQQLYPWVSLIFPSLYARFSAPGCRHARKSAIEDGESIEELGLYLRHSHIYPTPPNALNLGVWRPVAALLHQGESNHNHLRREI